MKQYKVRLPRLTQVFWFLYLTLMMAFIFDGAQQLYTFAIFVMTGYLLLPRIKQPQFIIKLKDFYGTIWYVVFALYVNLSKRWSVYQYNETGIANFVLFISVAVFCADYYFSTKESVCFFKLFANAGAVFCAVVLVTSPLNTYATDQFSGITGQYRTWIGELAAILFILDLCLYRYCYKTKSLVIKAMLAALVVLASGARGALLQIMCGLGSLFFFEKNVKQKFKWIVVSILAAILLVIVILTNSAFYEAFVTRMIGALRQDGSTKSLSERFYFMKTAWNLFKEHPVLGGGVDTMRGYLTSIRYWHVTYSHCEYTEILSSYGIIGGTIFFLPALCVVFSKKQSCLNKTIILTLLLGFVWSTNYYSFLFILLMSRLQFSKVEIQNE